MDGHNNKFLPFDLPVGNCWLVEEGKINVGEETKHWRVTWNARKHCFLGTSDWNI